VGGGAQVPGFIGVGKLYISSPKFIAAEGGWRRLLWMPKQLKADVEERLKAQFEKVGLPDLFDKIATEDDADTPEKLLEFLQGVGHPALSMDPML
jgi:acetyl-CoA synthase